jgi:hypothetical protein
MFTPPPAIIAGSVANATTPDHIAANNGVVAGAAAIASRYKGGSMGIGRHPTDDKIEVVTTF